MTKILFRASGFAFSRTSKSLKSESKSYEGLYLVVTFDLLGPSAIWQDVPEYPFPFWVSS